MHSPESRVTLWPHIAAQLLSRCDEVAVTEAETGFQFTAGTLLVEVSLQPAA